MDLKGQAKIDFADALEKMRYVEVSGEDPVDIGILAEIVDPDENNNREKYFGLTEDNTALIVLYCDVESNIILNGIQKHLPDGRYFLEPISYYLLGVYPGDDFN